jgi:hypothetical protein
VRCGKRHRYYVSRRLIAESGKPNASGWRLPAAALEGAVAQLIIDALKTSSAAQGLIDGATPEMLTKLPSAAKSLCSALDGANRGPTLRAIVKPNRQMAKWGPPPRFRRSGHRLADRGAEAGMPGFSGNLSGADKSRD